MVANDKVAGLLKCGQDNAPEAIQGLREIFENSVTVKEKQYYSKKKIAPLDIRFLVYLCILSESKLIWIFMLKS
jgi:hypothetical protein